MSKNSTLETHFKGKCKGDASHGRDWHVGEGHRRKQVRVFRCDRGASEYFPQYASQSGEVLLQDIQQLLEEMNSDMTASEATELDHKKTSQRMKRLSRVPSNTRRKASKRRRQKLSNDRKTWKGRRSTLMSRRHFLRISTQLDISEIQTTADSIEISMRMKIRHAISSARRKQTRIQPTCKAFPFLGKGRAFGVWLERRAELEKSIVELNSTRTTAKTWAIQLKLSRCAEEEERNAYTVFRNRIEASQDSQRKVLSSIGEDVRTVSRDTELLRFRRATTHTETWNRWEYKFSARNVALDLNYNESAALTDAHEKRYKFRTEDDIVASQSSIDWRIPKYNIACERLPDVFNDRRNCRENATDHCL